MNTDTKNFEGDTQEAWIAQDHGVAMRIKSGKHVLCRVYSPTENLTDEQSEAEYQANCRLIAAAPQLLRERDEARAERNRLRDALRDAALVLSGNALNKMALTESLVKSRAALEETK